MENNTKGIYCYRNKTFYYLETNNSFSESDLIRVKNALIARELINLTDPNSLNTSYKIMTLEQAKLENIETSPIYLSKHIKNVVTKTDNSQSETISIWD